MDFLKRFYKNANVRFIFFGLLLCLIPLLSKAGILKVSSLGIIAGVLFYAISVLGLNLLLGYSGLASLGVAGFMGLGAYIAAYASTDMGLPFYVGILAAIVIPTALGILVGLASLRISGLYLAIVTLCVSEILLKTFESVTSFTGGATGKKAPYPVFFGHSLTRETMFIFLVVVLVLVMIFTRNLVKGHFGRALNAMRGSEAAAQAMGVNLLKYRLLAFAFATAYSGLAGALYVYYVKFSYPTTWNLNLSLLFLAAVVIGGMRSVYGSVLGAFVVFAVPDLFIKPFMGGSTALTNAIPYIFNGILIIVILKFYPNGLIHLFRNARTFVLSRMRPKKNTPAQLPEPKEEGAEV